MKMKWKRGKESNLDFEKEYRINEKIIDWLFWIDILGIVIGMILCKITGNELIMLVVLPMIVFIPIYFAVFIGVNIYYSLKTKKEKE